MPDRTNGSVPRREARAASTTAIEPGSAGGHTLLNDRPEVAPRPALVAARNDTLERWGLRGFVRPLVVERVGVGTFLCFGPTDCQSAPLLSVVLTR